MHKVIVGNAGSERGHQQHSNEPRHSRIKPTQLSNQSPIGDEQRAETFQKTSPLITQSAASSSPKSLKRGSIHEDAHDAGQIQHVQESRRRTSIPSRNESSVFHRPLRSYADVSDENERGPWAKKAVLTLDGGGVRGYSSLLILQDLMDKVRAIEKSGGVVEESSDYPWMEKTSRAAKEGSGAFLPCHYFDYIAGTSTGGLSAIMLGRLRMSTEDALEKYTAFGNAVFGQARRWHERSILWFPRAKFSSRKTRNAILTVIYDRLKQQDPRLTDEKANEKAKYEPFESPDYKTRTIVFSACQNNVNIPHLWRTYDHKEDIMTHGQKFRHMNPSKAHREPLWQVARATTAAPTFFESIKIGGTTFFDGAIGTNNPAPHTYDEVCHKEHYAPGLFISIGTGIKTNEGRDDMAPKLGEGSQRKKFTNDLIDEMPRTQNFKRYLSVHNMFKDLSVDTEYANNRWLGMCDPRNTSRRRFSVEKGLGSIPLDDWRPTDSGDVTLKTINDLTQEYLDLEEVQTDLKDYAKQLVRQRQARAKTERWEAFATNIEYYCPIPTCVEKDGCHYSEMPNCRDRLREHFKYAHKDLFQSNYDDLEPFLDGGRLLNGNRTKEYDRTLDRLKRAASSGLSNESANSWVPK